MCRTFSSSSCVFRQIQYDPWHPHNWHSFWVGQSYLALRLRHTTQTVIRSIVHFDVTHRSCRALHNLCILLFPERCCHTAWYDTNTIQVINCWWFCNHHHVLTWDSFLCWLSAGACSKACPKLILLHRNYDSELSLDAFKLPLHGAAMTIAISKEQISTSLKAFSMISIPRGVKCSVLTQAPS